MVFMLFRLNIPELFLAHPLRMDPFSAQLIVATKSGSLKGSILLRIPAGVVEDLHGDTLKGFSELIPLIVHLKITS